jgi:hypothetical protein
VTKRNPTIYKSYAGKRPQYPFRLPADKKDEVEQMRLELGLSKQAFMEHVFEVGYPLLMQQMSGSS